MSSVRVISGGFGQVVLALGLTAGCTSVLGIDNEYVTDESAVTSAGGDAEAGGKSGDSGSSSSGGRSGSAGRGSGGTAGAGGRGETGGLAGGGGTTPDGGGGPSIGCGATAGECAAGQKCCLGANGLDTFCTAPEPVVGCSLLDCNRCPQPPASATAICNQDQCDIQCIDGFVRNGDACDPAGTGGTGGGGAPGTGGAPPVCDWHQCPSLTGPVKGCSIASPFACCKSDQTCGCSWATSGTASAYCL